MSETSWPMPPIADPEVARMVKGLQAIVDTVYERLGRQPILSALTALQRERDTYRRRWAEERAYRCRYGHDPACGSDECEEASRVLLEESRRRACALTIPTAEAREA
jgi:hypothetical protein